VRAAQPVGEFRVPCIGGCFNGTTSSYHDLDTTYPCRMCAPHGGRGTIPASTVAEWMRDEGYRAYCASTSSSNRESYPTWSAQAAREAQRRASRESAARESARRRCARGARGRGARERSRRRGARERSRKRTGDSGIGKRPTGQGPRPRRRRGGLRRVQAERKLARAGTRSSARRVARMRAGMRPRSEMRTRACVSYATQTRRLTYSITADTSATAASAPRR
jgi:hypothetical protein